MGNAIEKRMYTLRKGESPSSYLYIYLYFFFFSPVTIGRAETMASINRQEEEEEEKKKKKDFIYFFLNFIKCVPVHLSLARFSSEPRKQSEMPSHNFEMS